MMPVWQRSVRSNSVSENCTGFCSRGKGMMARCEQGGYPHRSLADEPVLDLLRLRRRGADGLRGVSDGSACGPGPLHRGRRAVEADLDGGLGTRWRSPTSMPRRAASARRR